jgi:hypothetical protein
MNLRRLVLLALVSAFALLLDSVAIGQSKDPMVGSWVLNRGNSEFNPPNLFFKRTMTVEGIDNGITCVTKTVDDRRASVEISYSARYDGKDVPIDGSALDTVSLRRTDANTVELTGKIQGKVVETATMKVSADGKVFTITTKGSFNQRSYSSTQVFDRQ